MYATWPTNSPVDPVWRDPIGSLDIPPLPLALAAKSIASLSLVLVQLAHCPQNVHKISRKKIPFHNQKTKKEKSSETGNGKMAVVGAFSPLR